MEIINFRIYQKIYFFIVCKILILIIFLQNQFQNAHKIPSARTTRLASIKNALIRVLSILVVLIAAAMYKCTELYVSAMMATPDILSNIAINVS